MKRVVEESFAPEKAIVMQDQVHIQNVLEKDVVGPLSVCIALTPESVCKCISAMPGSLKTGRPKQSFVHKTM